MTLYLSCDKISWLQCMQNSYASATYLLDKWLMSLSSEETKKYLWGHSLMLGVFGEIHQNNESQEKADSY